MAGVTTGVDLFGPTRYNWDNGYFQQDIDRRISGVDLAFTLRAWGHTPAGWTHACVLQDFQYFNKNRSTTLPSLPF